MYKSCKGGGLIKGCGKTLEIENFYEYKTGHFKKQCKNCINNHNKKTRNLLKITCDDNVSEITGCVENDSNIVLINRNNFLEVT